MRVQDRQRSRFALVATAALVTLLVACSSSGATSASQSTPPLPSATSSATPDAGCADVAAVKSSVEALTQVKPLQDGLTALNTAIDAVKTSLDAAAASASAALQPAVAQVKTAFAAVQDSVSGLSKGNLVQKAPSISSALQQLGTAAAALGTTLTQRCTG